MSCKRCRSSESNPGRFLLTCQLCKMCWHHRKFVYRRVFFAHASASPLTCSSPIPGCHEPPLSGKELTELLKASLSLLQCSRSADPASSALVGRTVDTWHCSRCETRSEKDGAANIRSQTVSSNERSSTQKGRRSALSCLGTME